MQNFPIKELKKLGYLPNTEEKHILVDNLLKFFGIASPEEWIKIYLAEEVSVAFRVSLAHTNSPYSISAWLRMGDLESHKLKLSLLPNKQINEIIAEGTFSKETLLKYSHKFRTPPRIIIGRLQYMKIIPYHFGNELREKVALFPE